MTKIVFFDIDGTMIDVFSELDAPLPSTVEAVKALQKHGHYAVVATARSLMPEGFEEISFDGHIFNNGTYIEFQDELLYAGFFEEKQVAWLVKLFTQYAGEFIFTSPLGAWVSTGSRFFLVTRHQELFGMSPADADMLSPWTPADVHATMVTALFENEKQLMDCRAELPEDWVVNTYTHRNYRMDIHLPGFTKGEAVQFLAKRLGIGFEDTYAFGDGINDLEMLTHVKHGIAMGNASEELLQVASDVTDDVFSDGIYNALKKYGVI